jgi:hypothetical protein
MHRIRPSLLAVLAAATLVAPASAADPWRQTEVARRGPDVMPFSLKATRHIFTKTPDGGVQSVVCLDPGDTEQMNLVRGHLREIRAQFLKGDFSGPAHIHGTQMPGLAELEAARPGQWAIEYRDVPHGGQLTYRAADARQVAALHDWFDAQVSDHGPDAVAGHPAHDHGAMMKR